MAAMIPPSKNSFVSITYRHVHRLRLFTREVATGSSEESHPLSSSKGFINTDSKTKRQHRASDTIRPSNQEQKVTWTRIEGEVVAASNEEPTRVG